MRVEYSSNNSGGSWWLCDSDWYALESAGWEVEWFRDETGPFSRGDRFLGALASRATREGLTMREAIEEWESVTGQSSNALGCACCGTPHNFYAYNEDGSMVDSYSPDYPSYGDRY